MTGNSRVEKKRKSLYENMLGPNSSFLLLISFFILFVIFVGIRPVVDTVSAQMLVIDSFSARGIIAMQAPQDMESNFQKSLVAIGDENVTNNAANIADNSTIQAGDKGTRDNMNSEDLEKKKLKSMSDFFKDYKKKYFYDSVDDSDETIKDSIELNSSGGASQNSIEQDNNVIKKNNNSLTSNNQPVQHQPSILKGQWDLLVKKGNPENFKVLLTLIQDGKISNVFGIFNLRDTEYIQLNEKGSKIITGKVDFKSAGLRNETINNVDAVISIQGFTQLRIDLDDTKTSHLFTKDPIFGVTKILVDGSGNILIGPPPPPPQQVQPRSIPTPSHSADKSFDETKNIF